MNIEEIVDFVKNAHGKQTDRGGVPYINHLTTVANAVKPYGEDYIKVALLHDVLEDTDVTPQQLSALGIERHIIEAVIAMSKRRGEDYNEYLKRVARNRIAKIVKIHDMEHNSDLGRIDNPAEHDYARTKKYQRSITKLKENLVVDEVLALMMNETLNESDTNAIDGIIVDMTNTEYDILMRQLEDIIEKTSPSW